jgi:DUF4097 and DUF4098 domain-containing protein YvlB
MEAMTFPAPGAVTLEISIGAGDVRVRERAGAVSLQVTGEQDPDQVTIESSEEPDGSLRVTVTERRRGISGWKRRKGLDITVDTPAQTTLDIDGGAVDLRSKGQVASLRFASGSGDARLDDVADDVVVKGASGDVRVRHVGGQLRVHLASGDVFADSVVGGATVRTASGDIALGTVAGESSITSLSGDVVIHRAEPRSLAVQAVSGDVEVGIAPGVPAVLDVSSLSGETRSELDISSTPSSGDVPPLDVKVNTVSGDVRIRRATKGSPA